MGKKKKDELGVSIKTVSAPPDGLTAVFDDGEGGYEQFPIIMFAVFAADQANESDELCGLISTPTGMIVADHDEALIGYRVADQKFDEFLEDHGRSADDQPEDDDEDDEDDDED